MSNKDNIVEKNMEANVNLQGQGANLNENIGEKNYNVTQPKMEGITLDTDSPKLGLNTKKNLTQNLNHDARDISSEGIPVHNETVENDGKLVSSRVSEVLDKNISDSEGVVTEAATESELLENVKPKQIVCEMVGDMCVMRVAVENEVNFNNIGEKPSEKSENMQVDSQLSPNDATFPNNNEIPGSSADDKGPIENASDSSHTQSDVGEDGSPHMLTEKVTKLNISPVPEVKKSNVTDSKVVVNCQTDSLKSLMAYDWDSDTESENSDIETQADFSAYNSKAVKSSTVVKTWRKNQEDDSEMSDVESDSSASTLSLESDHDDGDEENSDSGSVIDVSDDSTRIENSSVPNKNSDKGAVKKRNPNILDLEEFLPPVPDLSKLNINVDVSEFMHMGHISAIISELVTINSIPGTPAFDLDSMLFIDDQTSKKPIGPIFDVLGPVAEPIYCVRFNNEKEVKDIGLKSGMKVYAVPKNEEFTKYVFVQELMKMKGSDASWLNDHETPLDMAEFSDDEKEREARRAKKQTTIKRKLDDGSLERHKKYERTMNQCNTLNTRVYRLMDAHKNLSKHIRPNSSDIKSLPPEDPVNIPDISPPFAFDPTVPPPGFVDPFPYNPSMPFQYFNTSPGFGAAPNFTSNLSPYNNTTSGSGYAWGSGSPEGTYRADMPVYSGQFGNGPSPPRWNCMYGRESFYRRRQANNPPSNQHNNSDSYFTNNRRNSSGGAGPSSSQP